MRMLLKVLRLPPVVFFEVLAIASIAHYLYPRSLPIPYEAERWMGWTLVAAAFLIGISAFREFKKHHTTVEPGQRPTALVTSGVFARTRNPIYIGQLLVLSGIALLADAVIIAAALPLLWLALDRLVVRSEEATVREAFPEEYPEYARRVPRWFGRRTLFPGRRSESR